MAHFHASPASDQADPQPIPRPSRIARGALASDRPNSHYYDYRIASRFAADPLWSRADFVNTKRVILFNSVPHHIG